jgi:hypothetical protein
VKARPLLAAALAALLLLLALPADANHSAGFHWNSQFNPEIRVIKLDDGIVGWVVDEADWRERRNRVLRKYEQSGVLAFVVRRTGPSLCQDVHWSSVPPGTIELCAGTPNAQTNVVGSHAISAIASIEVCNLSGSKCAGFSDLQPGTGYAEQHTFCHELGHTLGLKHRPDPWSLAYDGSKSCMAFSASVPDQHDLDVIATAANGHVDNG